MDKDQIVINALVITARYSLKRGVKREAILQSLRSLIDKNLYEQVQKLI